MQERFLSFFGRLRQSTFSPSGLWCLHTDEPILQLWLTQALKPLWTHHAHQLSHKELHSVKSWHEVLDELNALSLFDDNVAIVLTGNHKPDNAILDKLTHFAQACQEGSNANHLLWCLPKQDKKALNHKALKLFDTHGILIDGTVYNDKHRLELLGLKAQEFGLTLTPDAWAMLMNFCQNNLLAGYQTLWQLSFGDVRHIDPSALQPVLQDNSQFDVFALSDSILAGNVAHTLRILHHLRQVGIAPSLVLWTLSKEARLLSQLHAGKDPTQLGIWQSKQYSYLQHAHRTTHVGQFWAKMTYDCDCSIKGLGNQEVWQALTTLALCLCGVFPMNGSP